MQINIFDMSKTQIDSATKFNLTQNTVNIKMETLNNLCVPAGVIQFSFWFRTECSVQILILIHTEIWSTRVWSDNSLLHGWDLMSETNKQTKAL